MPGRELALAVGRSAEEGRRREEGGRISAIKRASRAAINCWRGGTITAAPARESPPGGGRGRGESAVQGAGSWQQRSSSLLPAPLLPLQRPTAGPAGAESAVILSASARNAAANFRV